jgi:hypothetical protein
MTVSECTKITKEKLLQASCIFTILMEFHVNGDHLKEYTRLESEVCRVHISSKGVLATYN